MALVLVILAPAKAQTAGSAWLSSPNTEAFPRIEAFLDVHDAQGRFQHDLQTTDIRLTEDGRPLSVESIVELRPGLQVVVAVNPGPSLAVRDKKGVSRYKMIVETLSAWGKSRQGTTLDDWSLFVTGGVEVTHVSDPMEWVSAILSDTVDLQARTASLDTLSRAVEIASDPTMRPGMGRVVLFITPPLDGDLSLPLENLASRAGQQGVSVFIWLVSAPGSSRSPGVNPFSRLAEQTGGQSFNFYGDEVLPDPESFLEPLRYIYHLVYNSRVKSSGPHQLEVEVQTNAGSFTTPVLDFDLKVEPPNPAFISPAFEIQRKPSTADLRKVVDQISPADFLPREQVLNILVDFPDGRLRPLMRTTLYVDGLIVATNTEPPFEKFVWNLSQYATSGSHLLRVEAEDSLGLVGASLETQVQVTVVYPAQKAWQALYRYIPILVGLAIGLAGAILLLVLVWRGRIHPRSLGALPRRRRKKDPVTQPLAVKSEPATRSLPNWINRLQWPQRRVAPKAYAFLTRISETEHDASISPIPITADEITLGCDPDQAILVLDDPSVDALHARLIREADGDFRLADEGSIAGTWINYTPVSLEGASLEHGDLVHIGRIGFRFTLRQPGRLRKPVVTLVEDQR